MGKALKHLIRYLLGLDAAHTQTTEAERTALAHFASNRKRLVEIGVYEGFTTAILMRAMKEESKLYAVDPFIAGRMGICWGKRIARRETAKVRPRRQIVFVEKFSHEAAQMIQGDFDFVFIDGDHSLDGIRRDWTDWSSRIVPAGIIALHDTRVPAHNPNIANLGSYQYFEQHIRHDSRFEVVEQVDSLTILRRHERAGSAT